MRLIRLLSLSVALVSVLTRFMSKNSLSHYGIRDWDGEQKLHANKHHAPLVTLTGVEDTCLHLEGVVFSRAEGTVSYIQGDDATDPVNGPATH